MATSWRQHLLVAAPLAVLLVGFMLLLLALPGFSRQRGSLDELLPVAGSREQVFVRALVAPPDHDSIVILEVEGGGMLLPLFVSESEGQAIADARDGKSGGRLLARAVGALGGSIEGVVLDSSPGHLELRARVLMRGGQGGRAVRAGAAEAIAAALRAGKPIWATPQALEDSGVTAEDLTNLLRTAEKLRQEELARPSYAL